MLDMSLTRDVYNTVIDDIAKERAAIPRIPSHVVMIDRCARDENKSVNDLVRLIEGEPSLIARIMQVANSPFYGAINKAVNIKLAVSRLGMRMTRNIVMALAVRDAFRSPNIFINKRLHELWEESVEVAAISAVLAKKLHVDADTALLGGMIQHVGSLAVAGYCLTHGKQTPENYPMYMDSIAPMLNCPLGSAVLKEWKFPTELIEVVEKQCDPNSIGNIQPVDLVIVANKYVRLKCKEISEEEFNSNLSVKKLGMSFDLIVNWIDEYNEMVEDIKQPFK